MVFNENDCSATFRWTKEELCEQGDFFDERIAVGAIAELADEPHLHIEMTVNGIAVDPADYFSKEAKDTISGVNTDK